MCEWCGNWVNLSFATLLYDRQFSATTVNWQERQVLVKAAFPL